MTHATLPSAVIFDLDGTLIDSRADIAAACNHVLQWSGRAPLPIDTIAGFVGDGAQTLLARAFELPPGAADIEPLFQEWKRYYSAHPVEQTRLLPGAERALRFFAERRVQVALVTNKDRAVTQEILAKLGIAASFRALYGGGDGPLKPSPEPLLRVCRVLGVSPGEAWMVGDAAQDIAAARAAQVRAVAVSNGFQSEQRLREASPDALFDSLGALIDALVSPSTM